MLKRRKIGFGRCKKKGGMQSFNWTSPLVSTALALFIASRDSGTLSLEEGPIDDTQTTFPSLGLSYFGYPRLGSTLFTFCKFACVMIVVGERRRVNDEFFPVSTELLIITSIHQAERRNSCCSFNIVQCAWIKANIYFHRYIILKVNFYLKWSAQSLRISSGLLTGTFSTS